MINSIDSIIDLHKSSGSIEDAYMKIYIDDKILNLNIYSLKVTAIKASNKDVELWNDKILTEVKKDKKLEKEIKEFEIIFNLINKLKIKKGKIEKRESPDFIITRKNNTIGIEVTKIYVGNDWIAEEINDEIREFQMTQNEIEGYVEYKKAGEKVNIDSENGKINLTPKIDLNHESDYGIIIENKIYEKIRKLLEEYEKFKSNVIYVEITSPEYFEDITDMDKFSKKIRYYIEHLEDYMPDENYSLVIRINNKWIEINLKDGKYKCIK